MPIQSELLTVFPSSYCIVVSLRYYTIVSIGFCIASSLHHVTSSRMCLTHAESGGDNLAANFSRELSDFTIYVVDVAGTLNSAVCTPCASQACACVHLCVCVLARARV